MGREDVEVIKVELPKWLAERFRGYVAEKHGFRRGWEESYRLLNKVKEESIKALMLHFAIHGISAILGKPNLVAKLLIEILSWRGLAIIDLSINDEIAACEIASKLGLDFYDGLHYYLQRLEAYPS